ncbi:hypothetical protein AMECASPLE_038767 [Ameca splendens]|uniref:Uncharacterized protein n=1 Tax=Ameca splendens TaxID=208324 RepID=A0ABV0Y866_9TELE
MKTQASQSYLWLARERQSVLSEELPCAFIEERKKKHSCYSIVVVTTHSFTNTSPTEKNWFYPDTDTATRPHLALKDAKIGWDVNGPLPRTPPHAHKFLLSLHSNHPNATVRQDDNSVYSSL